MISALQYSCSSTKTKGFQNNYVNVLENVWKVNADGKDGTVFQSLRFRVDWQKPDSKTQRVCGADFFKTE